MSQATYRLRIGERLEAFNLPKGLEAMFIVKGRGFKPGVSAREAVVEAFKAPIDGFELQSLAEPEAKAVLLVDDHTRPTPTAEVADILLNSLRNVKELRVVVALGLHPPPPSLNGLKTKLGDELLKRAVLHDPRRNLTHIGRTVNGTEVYINSLVAESDLRVAVGTITPHPFAGFSGGPKMLLPGTAGEETIKANHSLARKTGATIASIENNPVYQDEAYAASKLPTYIVNLLPSPGGGYLGAVAGEALKAHKEGVAMFMEHHLYRPPRLVDVAITNSYPADVNLYQSWKAVFTVAEAVRPGGVIVLATPAPEGVPRDKLEIARRFKLGLKSLEELEVLVDKLPDYVFGLIYLKLRQALQDKELIVVSPGLVKREVEVLGFTYASSIQGALKMVQAKLGSGEVLINNMGAEAVIKPVKAS